MEGQFELQERLLRALAEDLKLPLLQIARQAELGLKNDSQLASINAIAEMSLHFVDGFLLSLEQQQVLNLEPVSLSSLLYDTAEALQPMAHLHGCEIDINLSGRYEPVMTHPKSLQAAFMLLGYSLIKSDSAESKNRSLILAAHRSVKGLVAGLFNDQEGLTTDMLRRGRALYGHAHQSMPQIGSGSGAGVFVADSLLKSMAAPLHLARHNKLTGLAATLIPSKQLQLV